MGSSPQAREVITAHIGLSTHVIGPRVTDLLTHSHPCPSVGYMVRMFLLMVLLCAVPVGAQASALGTLHLDWDNAYSCLKGEGRHHGFASGPAFAIDLGETILAHLATLDNIDLSKRC